jgi:hypothetical protein
MFAWFAFQLQEGTQSHSTTKEQYIINECVTGNSPAGPKFPSSSESSKGFMELSCLELPFMQAVFEKRTALEASSAS